VPELVVHGNRLDLAAAAEGAEPAHERRFSLAEVQLSRDTLIVSHQMNFPFVSIVSFVMN
jgi:hypothetical protein